MFTIKRVHISQLAKSELLLSFLSSLIAINPIGVAAQPSPNIFAIIFDAIYSLTTCPFGMPGKRRLITGLKAFVNDATSPHFFATCIIPVHMDIMPTIDMHRLTASLEE